MEVWSTVAAEDTTKDEQEDEREQDAEKYRHLVAEKSLGIDASKCQYGIE